MIRRPRECGDPGKSNAKVYETHIKHCCHRETRDRGDPEIKMDCHVATLLAMTGNGDLLRILSDSVRHDEPQRCTRSSRNDGVNTP